MSCELSIPISGFLTNENELKAILYSGFKDFNRKIPTIDLDFTENSDINGFVNLSSNGIFCNYLISKFDTSVTEHEYYEYLIMVSCRGNWLLAYIVSYCFIKKYDSYAIDDCGAIPDGKGFYKYNLLDMKNIILNSDLSILPNLENT